MYPARLYVGNASIPLSFSLFLFFLSLQHLQRLCSRSMTGGWDRYVDIVKRQTDTSNLSAILIVHGDLNGRAWPTVLYLARRAVKVVDTGGAEIIDRARHLHIRELYSKQAPRTRCFSKKGSIPREADRSRRIKSNVREKYVTGRIGIVNCDTWLVTPFRSHVMWIPIHQTWRINLGKKKKVIFFLPHVILWNFNERRLGEKMDYPTLLILQSWFIDLCKSKVIQ